MGEWRAREAREMFGIYIWAKFRCIFEISKRDLRRKVLTF